MINVENANSSCRTASGLGLRETSFYSLFSCLQVYKTRTEMMLALPCISDGALSLDGGMIKRTGLFSLGSRWLSGLQWNSLLADLVGSYRSQRISKSKQSLLPSMHGVQSIVSHPWRLEENIIPRPRMHIFPLT
ncbi:hypothetical protein Syun_019748 [Stephania yunnanensis]|uniref:Uncharacterized protein n=1 Tax=Stephania yunnanensis TaxID=152371 RepID=A0AAP0IX28_9MAGN